MESRQTRRVNQARYGASNNRSAWGYWVPLAITVTAATAGLVAWAWSERKEEDGDSSADERYGSGGRPPPGGGYASMSGGLGPGQGPGPGPGPYVDQPPPPGGYEGGPSQPPWGPANRSIGAQSTGVEETRNVEETRGFEQSRGEDTGIMARMTNVLGMGRSASPSKAYGWASRNVTAGMAAVGAAVGGALGYSEETKDQFEDHNRWSEEAERKDSERPSRGLQRRGTAQEFYDGEVELPRSYSINNGKKRKTVILVVSSVQNHHDDDVGSHASILAALPSHVDHTATRIFVLIYAPSLTAHPFSPAATNANAAGSNSGSVNGSSTRPISRNSSFSHINTDEGRTPGDFPGENSPDGGILVNVDPQPIDESTTSLYKTLHNQAMALVDRDTMIIPFTSPQGHKHIIKSLQPEIVYIQESLCGTEGEIVAELSSRWVRTTVVVIGDEGGLGGLVDTDTEDEQARKGSSGGYGQKWWKREERTGVGRGVSVVEALRVGEDWRRRVGGED